VNGLVAQLEMEFLASYSLSQDQMSTPFLLAALLVAVLALIVVPVLILRTITRMKNRSKDLPPIITSNVPIPIVGPAIEFGKSPMKMVHRCYEAYGPVFTVPIFHKRLTFLVGPQAQEPFFTFGDDILSQQEVYGFMKPVFGPGVVYDASRTRRQVQFQKMAHGLRASRLKGYIGKIERETRAFLREYWNDTSDAGTVVDLFQTLSELTILTASRCLHGDDVRENLFREVSALYYDLDHGVTPLSVFWSNAPTRAHAKRDAARKAMVQLFTGVIEARRKAASSSLPQQSGDGTDILTIFMDMKYKDGTAPTTDEITGLLIALLFAGQHTSAITSTWTALFIASHPHIMKRVVEEQQTLLGDSTAPVDFDKVNEMELLHNCMREALRLCPPLTLLMRYAKQEFNVTVDTDNKGAKTTFTVPQGDMVLVSPSVGMRIPEAFPNPDEFDPDRFAEPREEHKIPYAYLGFGGGMHSCMGQNFAFVQVKTILSILFREYEIELVSSNFPEQDFEAMVVGPKGDCRVRYKKKKN
jgi:sterol 14-demethylase